MQIFLSFEFRETNMNMAYRSEINTLLSRTNSYFCLFIHSFNIFHSYEL